MAETGSFIIPSIPPARGILAVEDKAAREKHS
jgi:hypothetical protein